MEQQGLRDVDRWKDKIEVRLDNRQVAFLFFGSALVACLLFILGVIVGKRLESRGRALAPEIEDPLALLDRVASTTRGPSAGLPTLGGTSAPRREDVAPAVASARPASRAEPPIRKPAPPPAPAPAVAASAVPPAAKTAVPPPAPARAEPVAAATVREAGRAKARFMLQIGSFPDRAEAEAFAGGFPTERPIVVVSEIPGKGTWYRVRLGAFQTFREGVDAKLVFEKRYNKIALVVGPL
jgi:DedD protein